MTKKPQSGDDEAIIGLRNQLFQQKSKDVFQDAEWPSQQFWGVVMETAYPEAKMTVVSLADGTTSVYYSSGGGVIGAGEHEQVRSLSAAISGVGPLFFSAYATPEIRKDFPYPSEGNTHFYFLRDDGVIKTDEAPEEVLGEDQHMLSPLFHATHMLISLLMETQQGDA